MSAVDECVTRVESCVTTTIEQCAVERDDGHAGCIQERDDGYRDCCGWIPCRWFCRVWVWVKNIVCVLWQWFKFMVCVVWEVIKSVICVIWTVLSFLLCLVSRKLVRALDGIGSLAVDVIEGFAGAVAGGFGGAVYFITHPVDSIGNIIDLFRGCPDVTSDALARDGLTGILNIAHHGYIKIWPENTAQSCNAALRRGADAIEIDLCLTSDSHVIVWHDWSPDHVASLARQTGRPSGQAYYPRAPPVGSSWRAPVDELPLEDFREHYGYRNDEDGAVRIANDISYGVRDTTIPTLAEFLAHVDRDRLRVLFLDIKMPGTSIERAGEMVDRIHEALTEADLLGLRTVLMVPDFGVLRAMQDHARENDYNVTFTWDVEFPPGIILNPERYSAVNHAVTFHNTVASVGKPTGLTAFPWRTYRKTIKYDIGRWNSVNADPAGENAGQTISMLIAWTLEDEDELRCLVRMGVSGIITDSPELLARILGRTI